MSDANPLMVQSMGGLLQRIPPDRVAKREGLTRSLMLSAEELGLKPQDVANVAAFLREVKP